MPTKTAVYDEPKKAHALDHPANTGEYLLHTHGIRKVYDGRTVVNGVNINVRPGEIVGLLGPNGAGKTTTFYMIVGIVQPNGGKVVFNYTDVTQFPMYQRARLGMGPGAPRIDDARSGVPTKLDEGSDAPADSGESGEE